MYIERAIQIAEKYPALFDFKDPVDAFVLIYDFPLSGRVSAGIGVPRKYNLAIPS
jgi:hypothetical protein